jgi:hypothetical protein
MGKWIYHPGDQASAFSNYLSTNGHYFKIDPDSCMCGGCYKDAKAFVDSGIPKQPRWVKLHAMAPEQHCAVCHFELLQYSPASTPQSSPCKLNRFGPRDWHQGFSLSFWVNLFKCTRPNFNMRLTHSSRLCHHHYMETYNRVKSKAFTICNTKKSDVWNMCFENQAMVKASLSAKGKSVEISQDDWLCLNCYNSFTKVSKVSKSPNKPSLEKQFLNECITDAFNVVEAEGFVLRKILIQRCKEKLNSQKHICVGSPMDTLGKYQNLLTSKMTANQNICKYSDSKCMGTIGTMFYHRDKITCTSVAMQIYHMMHIDAVRKNEIEQWSKDGIKLSDITGMIQRQVELFKSAASHVDYRDVVKDAEKESCKDEESFLLGTTYLHQPLVKFVQKITNCGKYGNKSDKDNHKDTFKIQMVIAILCDLMNRTSLLLQHSWDLCSLLVVLRTRCLIFCVPLGLHVQQASSTVKLSTGRINEMQHLN